MLRRREFLRTTATIVIAGAFTPDALAKILKSSHTNTSKIHDDHIRDYLHKMRNFNRFHKGDICLDKRNFKLLERCITRLKRLEVIVGHGNFHLLDFDDALIYARNYSQVGRFTKEELDFLEMIFYEDASQYGFLGEKPLNNLTNRMNKKEIIKVPHTGNYVYKGVPLEIYKKIRRDVGSQAILISGVRSIVKQFMLFLNKAYLHKGNLSLASRSLAPPGYSFHGISDFDVGQVELGSDNFTERFIGTDVYRKINELDYVNLRYNRDNLLGVRFEPWHIKVDS
ncbi:MAG: M15 family metallopeptidase [Thermodesulfobacteriota bacterium]|nr:M15 family metallopeptidase [Thermodesulfobacteriota bacterium]